MGCSTYLGLGWRYQPLAPGHPTSICDIGVNAQKLQSLVCYKGGMPVISFVKNRYFLEQPFFLE